MTKLLIVDVQKDFCENGALACQGGWTTARRVSNFLEGFAEVRGAYTEIIASRDYHLADSTNGGHIAIPPDEPDYVDVWPPHCVAGTSGAEYALEFPEGLEVTHIVKGYGVPAYSALEGHHMASDVEWDPAATLEHGEEYDVCGIATDYCVKASVLGLLERGIKVNVLQDMCVGVTQEGHDRAIQEMRMAGANIR